MEQYKMVIDTLEKLNIPYNLVSHPPAFTTEEADGYIEGLQGVRTKTLFLCNKKSKAFYLLVMDDSKQLDMKHLEDLLCEKGLHFCSAEKLMAKLQLLPGAVSIFGLLNNAEKDVNVILDEDMLSEEIVCFHPNENTSTLFFKTDDMFRFIAGCGFEYKIMKL
ncbi:MAG: prolyl-tRNA synthetase associated domain-containing protein [Anaerovoracaceae bacterium]